MNKLLALIGLAALVSITAQAQSPTYQSQTLWTTNGAGIPAATAVLGNAVADVRYQKDVTLQITAYGNTGAAASTYVFVPSVDGTSYGSSTLAGSQVKAVSFTPATTGTTMVTNISTAGVGYLKFLYVTNDTGAAVTNISIKYGVKISSP